jgi:hypothetical protein
MKRSTVQAGSLGAATAVGAGVGAALGSLAFGIAFGIGIGAVAAYALGKRKPPAA